MVKTAGQEIYDGRTVSFESDGTVSAGDAVMFDANGQLTPALDGDLVGVAADTVGDHSAGDRISVHVSGIVVGNVASGVTADATSGLTVGASADGDNAGELIAGGDEAHAFCDEGGSYRGGDIATGYSAVHLG